MTSSSFPTKGNPVNSDEITNKVTEALQRYASDRLNNVERGIESREFAGLMVEKYGEGVLATLRIFDHDRLCNPLQKALDAHVEAIDPEASAHRRKRYRYQAHVGLTSRMPGV